MARECYVCAKGTVSGNTVSHSNIHNKRTWKPNLKKVRIVEDGTVKTVNVCTRCLRSGKVERAQAAIPAQEVELQVADAE